MEDSPGRMDTVLDDCDFLLQLAEEAATDRMVASGHMPAPKPAATPLLTSQQAAELSQNCQTSFRSLTDLGMQPQAPRIGTGAAQQNGFYVEPMSGLKVSRPVLGSVIVRERLSDRLFIKLGAIRQVLSDSGCDWATVAVLASKVQQETRNGGFYSRWQLSDLDSGSVTLFVFGDAHKELYKEELGSVMILYNAKPSADKGPSSSSSSHHTGGLSLSVDKPEQVTRIGHSPDFAYCKGNKRDGTQCRHIVCRSKCEYCPYHAASALRQLTSHRPDLRGHSLLERQLRPEAAKVQPWQKHSGEGFIARPPPPQLSGRQLGDAATNLLAVRKAGLTANTSTQSSSASMFRAGFAVGASTQASSAAGAGRGGVVAGPGGASGNVNRNRGLEAMMALASADEHTQPAHGPSQRPVASKQGSQAGSRAPGKPMQGSSQQQQQQQQEDELELESDDGDGELQALRNPSAPISAAQARLLAAVAAQRVGSTSTNGTQAGASQPAATASQATPSASASTTAHAASGSTGAGVVGQAGARNSSNSSTSTGVVLPASQGLQSSRQAGLQPGSSRHNSSNNTGRISSASAGVGAGKPAVVGNNGHQSKEQSKMMASLGLGKRRAPDSTAPVAAAPAGGTSHTGGTSHVLHKARGPGQPVAVQGRRPPAAAAAPAASSAMAAAFGAVVARVNQEAQAQQQEGPGLQSRYHDLGEEGSWEQVQGILDNLEKKDALVQQLDSVKSLKVTAFQCAECNLFTEYRRKECAQHTVTRVTTNKRFWICCHCNGRSTSLGVIYPKKRCPKCNDPGMDFKPATMYSGSQGNKPAAEGTGLAARTNMLARGTEHSFSLHST